MDLSVKYAGLQLSSPVIVSSSGLTSSVNRIKKIEEAGAGAVVLKSLFEEQIRYEVDAMDKGNDYPEAEDYLNAYAKENSLNTYLDLITEAKKAVKIPVIASVNCHSSKEWTHFTKKMEDTGADALELNIYYLANDKRKDPREYEETYLNIVEEVTSRVKIPVTVKLGMHFSNPSWMADQVRIRGAAGLVLFNRFYAPDINTDELRMESAEVLSNQADMRYSLRWVGIISSTVEGIDISASTGVHNGLGVVKQLLAGADAVQICSVLYRNGIEYTQDVIAELKSWMERKKFNSVEEFKGRMSYKNIQDPAIYERAQFIKYYSNMH